MKMPHPFSETGINNGDIVGSNVCVIRRVLEIFDDLLRFFPLTRNRIGVPKTGPHLSRAPKRYRLSQGSNILRKSALSLIRSELEIVIEPIIWIEIDG